MQLAMISGCKKMVKLHISQLPMVQIRKFLCPSVREFPEFFRTHPTLICRSIFMPLGAFKQTGHVILPYAFCVPLETNLTVTLFEWP